MTALISSLTSINKYEQSWCFSPLFVTIVKNWPPDLHVPQNMTKFSKQNSLFLCPGRVRSREIEFWHRPFPFFLFFDCNQLKQQFGHEFEQQFELELNPNKNSSSSYCFCSRSAHARRRLWEPSDTMIIPKFQVGGPPFLKQFRNGFFLKNGAKWSFKWPQQTHKIWSKTNLERSQQNMLNMC